LALIDCSVSNNSPINWTTQSTFYTPGAANVFNANAKPNYNGLVINEIHYHPSGDDSSLEYIEFYNQLVVDVDLSNWRLAGDVNFDFPEGTVIPGRSYLVVAQDPSALASATGFSGALGPYSGSLSNSSGRLRLYNNNRSFRSLPGGSGSIGEVRDDLEARRIMDEIEFADVSPWPVGPDGSGASLAKRDPSTGTGHPHHWAASVSMNGTPGRMNSSPAKPMLAINELSSTSDPNFRVELFNYGSDPISLTGMIVGSSNPSHQDYVIPSGILAAGSFMTIDAEALGFIPEDNNRVFLYAVNRFGLIDAARADDRALARLPDGTGRWLRPDTASFGSANSFALEDAIVINEIFYSAYPEREPFREREEEWLELFNRSASSVDLTDWSIEGGIRYDFPANTVIPSGGYLVVARDSIALSSRYPGLSILGDYSGRLGNGGDLIRLEDEFGNPADEVRYYDSGKWSDESARTSWQTYTYEGVAVEDGHGDNLYHELQLGLLDAGEFLIDDVSVIENGNTECIQNGDFESDSVGALADKWRVIGTHGSHGRTLVASDPDNPGNQCLHVVSTGPTENKHNKIETTFADNKEIVAGNTYRISFRARWLSGSNQLNSRLYFSFLQRTQLLETTEVWGTPGVVNSTSVSNVGPTFSSLSHFPIVPDANESVSVEIDAQDPDGINNLTLFYSVNDGGLQSATMSMGEDGRYSGTIPGQSTGATVRFHVRGLDAAGVDSTFPAAGVNGGAFYKVQDGFADTSGIRHNFRVVMSQSDQSFLYLNTNRMSNDRIFVTVIEDETTAYYDVALRLKASGHGRFQRGGYGFNMRFQPDDLFRGVHQSVVIERSGNYRELLAKNLTSRAGGGYWSFYDDVTYLIPPIESDRGVALIAMSRHTGQFFDGLFPSAEQSGTLFNQELTYSPNGTTGGPEGLKIGNPFNQTNGRYDLVDRGLDKEPYRWGYQIRSARGRDDYSRIVELNRAMELDGEELVEALDSLIDIDQWMRTFAMLSLNGTDDVFGRFFAHNFRFFVRPTDQKVIVLQWDLDRAFRLGANVSAVPTTNNQGNPISVARLFNIPQYRRLFDAHVQDLTESTFNSTYVGPWASHFSSLTGDNLNTFTNYITGRANGVANSLPDEVAFGVLSNSGVDFSVSDSVVTLEGRAGIEVFTLQVNGLESPITWLDGETWQIEVPVQIGENPLNIVALNNRDTAVATASITVSNTGSVSLADAGNTLIRELHYHPSDPSAVELAEGFLDADDFEFVEINNIDASFDVDLSGVSFTDGIEFTFPAGIILAPGESVILVSNQAAFEERYGVGVARIGGTYSGSFRNSGEHVQLEAADASIIADFTYGDGVPWSSSADGDGYSLVFAGSDPSQALDWRSSVSLGGSPGSSDSVPFSGGDIISFALAENPRAEIDGSSFLFSIRVNLGADDVTFEPQFSTDLITWTPAEVSGLTSRVNNGDGTETLLYQSPFSFITTPKQFASVVLESR